MVNELTDVLADETVIDCVTNPDGSLVVFAEDGGPAPNAVEVFADHTTRKVEEIAYGRDGQLAYEIGVGQ